MAIETELEQLEAGLRVLVERALRNGEDLASIDDMQRFVERVLEQNGYVLRGDEWVPSSN